MVDISIEKVNNDYYNKVWSHSKLMPCDSWPVWSLLSKEMAPGRRLLELGPGVRPKIPVKGSWFVEISDSARSCLEKCGGKVLSSKDNLERNFFDVVCAFEVLEHIKDDSRLLKTLYLSMKKDGRLFISVPLSKRYWTEWDNMVGHYRRYSPSELGNLLIEAGFEVVTYAEDPFARAYTGRISQKLAKILFMAFPELSISLEGRIIRVLCWYARMFRPLKWMKGSFGKIPENWAGVYVVCRKAN